MISNKERGGSFIPEIVATAFNTSDTQTAARQPHRQSVDHK